MNWDAFWDGITGLIRLPDILILRAGMVQGRMAGGRPRDERLLDRYNREAKDASGDIPLLPVRHGGPAAPKDIQMRRKI